MIYGRGKVCEKCKRYYTNAGRHVFRCKKARKESQVDKIKRLSKK